MVVEHLPFLFNSSNRIQSKGFVSNAHCGRPGDAWLKFIFSVLMNNMKLNIFEGTKKMFHEPAGFYPNICLGIFLGALRAQRAEED